MEKIILVFILPLLLLGGIAGDQVNKAKEPVADTQADKDLMNKAHLFFQVLPLEALNPENVASLEKIKLGKVLYFDKRLSLHETQSCNTCHNLATYGVDNLPTSPGDNGLLGTRNSPTVLNAAFKGLQFWDGRNKDVEEQAGGPILNPVEMAITDEQLLIDRLQHVDFYQKLFKDAYPNEENPFTYKNIRNSIAAFERTLITPSAFDSFLGGDMAAMTEQEKSGLNTFIDQGCIACHTGNVLGGNMYQKFGLFGNYADLTGSKRIDYGKFDVTKNEADKFMFYVPALRNVEKTFPYFHDGSVADLSDAIRIMGKAELNKDLSADQIADILVFMKSLTGKVPAGAADTPVELLN